MAEEEALFDLLLKKKKKKKRTPADFEASQASLAETAGQDDEVAVEQQPPEAADAAVVESAGDAGNTPQPGEDLAGDLALSKKKKKKKKPFDLAEMEEALPTEDKEVEYDTEKIEDFAAVDVNEEDFDMSLPSKKKKKKKVKIIEDSQMADEKDDEKEGVILSHGSFKQDSEREYTYEELLKRVVDIMHEKNPDMVTGEKKRFVMKPPQVMRVGTKKSCFANFTDICKMLHRQPEHLLHFLLAELGTSGSIDGNNHLIIKGRFQQKQIENVLRKYIKEYVTCHTCRSPETLLQKDTRIYFLQCETCGSRCSVQSIKSGFQAVTGKRAAIRAKTA